MRAPYERPMWHNKAVALLNNTWLSTGYFIQNGITFWNGWGGLVYATTGTNYEARYYETAYESQSEWHTLIFYINSKWWPCILSYNVPGSWECVEIPYAETGYATTIVAANNTSVFLEVQSIS